MQKIILGNTQNIFGYNCMEVMDTFALFLIYKYEVYQLDTDFIPKQNYVSVIILCMWELERWESIIYFLETGDSWARKHSDR